MKTQKRLFQILDDMNQSDTESGAQGDTALVKVGIDFLEANSTKKGLTVKMGIAGNAHDITKIMQGKYTALLLIIDRDDYNNRV